VSLDHEAVKALNWGALYSLHIRQSFRGDTPPHNDDRARVLLTLTPSSNHHDHLPPHALFARCSCCYHLLLISKHHLYRAYRIYYQSPYLDLLDMSSSKMQLGPALVPLPGSDLAGQGFVPLADANTPEAPPEHHFNDLEACSTCSDAA
jgi:hypothetical protein